MKGCDNRIFPLTFVNDRNNVPSLYIDIQLSATLNTNRRFRVSVTALLFLLHGGFRPLSALANTNRLPSSASQVIYRLTVSRVDYSPNEFLDQGLGDYYKQLESRILLNLLIFEGSEAGAAERVNRLRGMS